MAQRVARGRVAMDLKLSILSALNKLADRDTQQIATDELLRIAETLQPDGISVFLGCLYEISSDQKSVVRREGVKLLGILATLYGDLLTPHLQKIIASLVKRLKEPDSNIRDACVDTFGTLVAHVPAPASLANGGSGGGNQDQVAFSGPVGVFTKPLFDTLNEQARSVQIGAAMSLARAMDNARDLPPACTQRLCVRILKFLSSPNFNAKPALLPSLGGLSRASGVGITLHLAAIIASLQESLQSSDWATRKAAADTFASVALSVGGPPLTNFKSSTMALLDSYRFDKVKPARESVVDAIHIWKNVPDPPVVDSSPSRTVSTKSNDSNGTLKSSSNRKHLTSDLLRSCSPNPATSAQDKGSVKKKTTGSSGVSERKTNLDFFRKLSIRNSDDWQIEVAVPRGSPPASHNKENHEEAAVVTQQALDKHIPVPAGKVAAVVNALSNGSLSESHEEKDKLGFNRRPSEVVTSKFEAVETKPPVEEVRSINKATSNGWSHHSHSQQSQQQQQQQQKQVDASNSSSEQQKKSEDLVSIGRQLSQLEKGQSDLMEMLQEFMGNSHENTLNLESRVQRLERALEDMARLTAASIGISRNSFFGDEGGDHMPEVNGSAATTRVAGYFPDRSPIGSNNRFFRENSETWNEVFRAGRANGRSSHIENQDGSERSSGRAHNTSNGGGRLVGEGPSARSVWRASKDEATLAAIRVAGDVGGGNPLCEADNLKLLNSAGSMEASSESAQGGGNGGGNAHHHQLNGSSWNVWSRIMESLQSGDLDSAYEEVICTGDELLMVRLMTRTGPVLDQLSSETVSELLHSISQFLQQPGFVDCALPWIRQLTELFRANGPKCLALSAQVKKELLSSMHEASMLDFPDRWMAGAVTKMANQLGSSWSMVGGLD
ncbi:TORTIFOLIA1-like protein 1 [Selaginella moellendorffii]|uniref:TORTIFOLIA1-like protein 1 n=1 Tax=Selaginella moellendorffii TaxID=88036 RepID=UPI000D1C9984|nr:TORTIFOLIA1-like protein 1 [Selaginella moellendorffii]|eukprot:XP_024517693.1 TORTIFOLIA1-like protein 1 [Selaginella moellendorffii]